MNEFGWIKPKDRSYGVKKDVSRIMQDMPLFSSEGTPIAGTGKGKVALLHKVLERVAGGFPVLRQEIGDCFAGDTLVFGENTKEIKDVEVGDKIFTGEGKLTTVVSKRKIECGKRVYKISPDGGMPFVCTEDHKFYVCRGSIGTPEWVQVKDLTSSDYLLSPNVAKNAVSKNCFNDDQYSYHSFIKDDADEKFVYDIGVEDEHHSFLANGFTAHNCVSFGYAGAIMTRLAVETFLDNDGETWPGNQIATEWIYGTSRVLVGKGRMGNSDGSVGSWAAKAIQEHGTLLRRKYDKYDLSNYSGQRAKSWGFRGLPYKELEPIADEHPVQKVALITSYEAARDAIVNGYPVAVCSNQGFQERRDSDGFARPSGSWSHCLYFCSVDDLYKRVGLLCQNSWGPNWISGPKRHDQPDGSFWVDASVVDRMLRGEDSFAIAGYEGFVEKDGGIDLW